MIGHAGRGNRPTLSSDGDPASQRSSSGAAPIVRSQSLVTSAPHIRASRHG